MATKPTVLSITSLRGGLNNSDPEHALPEDQCVRAENVEFFESMVGERRKGSTAVDLPAAITGNANIQAITFLHRHLPTTDSTAAELWLMGQNLSSQNYSLQRKTTSWSTISPVDEIDVTNNAGVFVTAQTLHGKLFIAYKSVGSVNRLHVWDGTSLRRTGLAEPAAPSVADTGAGSYSGTRYFRVRYAVLSGAVVLLRSEPSDTTTFVPSGAGSAARITKPTTISEGETHWEVEASVDNANFYRIARVIVGTTTYDDSTVFASGYATAPGAVLSEDIGDYSLIHSGKFLSVDNDRLLIAGSWEDSELASRVSWTPVRTSEGAGNDERIPIDIDSFLDLDGFEGGPITAISRPVNGYVWIFKQSHTYRLVRTGRVTDAYQAVNVSKSVGAVSGSVIEGVDQTGMPCLYFLDPELGPCRTGGNKIVQTAGNDIATTWDHVNIDAIVIARGIFFPHKQQIHWWLASSDPNQVI